MWKERSMWENQQWATLRQDILTRQTELFNDCGKAEERLAALFGPLNVS
jgi:hypothetical protein